MSRTLAIVGILVIVASLIASDSLFTVDARPVTPIE